MRALIAVIATAGLAACAPPPAAQRDAAAATVPGPDTAAAAYRVAGFLVQRTPPAFAGAVRFLPGPTADSTLAIVSLSLANNALTFHRAPTGFAAAYRVEASFTSPAGNRRMQSEEAVRVTTFAETRRSEESVIFQQTIALVPGEATVNLAVFDANGRRSSSDQQTVSVPAFAPGRAPALVPVYRATPRADARSPLDLVVNPVAQVSLAADTLRIYYEPEGPAEVTARIVDESGREAWRSQPAAGPGVFSVLPGELPPGRLRVEGFAPGSDTARVVVFAGSGDPWSGGSFVQVLDLLRYHKDAAAIAAMRAAPDTARTTLWRSFWKSSYPDGATAIHEGLASYFSRVRSANTQFSEGRTPGWLTDRGEVYIRFGEPETVTEIGGEMGGRSGGAGCAMSCGSLVWRYERPLPSFIFVFDARLGRYRLDAGSLRELQRYLGNQRSEPARAPVAKDPGLGRSLLPT